jgi:hypothetical protein
MTAPRESSPRQLFFQMMGGIALTSAGPILLVLILIVHLKIGGHILFDFPKGILCARLIAMCAMSTGLPLWFFTQLRLARSIRDGEWSEAKLKSIRRIVFALPISFVCILALLAYLIGICLRGRYYWLVGFSVLAFPCGALGDLHSQFMIRDGCNEPIDPVPALPAVLPY